MDYLQKESNENDKVIVELRIAIPNKNITATHCQIDPKHLCHYNNIFEDEKFKNFIMNNLIEKINLKI